jgi:hypothetical protein
MLLCLWKAEIHEYAITQVLRDKSIVFADRSYAGVAVLAQQADDVLWIQIPAERGGADQVYENDSDLAALYRRYGLKGRVPLRRCNSRRSCHSPQLRHGRNEFAAATER